MWVKNFAISVMRSLPTALATSIGRTPLAPLQCLSCMATLGYGKPHELHRVSPLPRRTSSVISATECTVR